MSPHELATPVSSIPLLHPFPAVTPLSTWPARMLDLVPGRYRVQVPVARLLSGHDLALTVHIIRGEGDGPTFGMVAGIHGDEIPGVRCVRDTLIALDPAGLRGMVIAVPVANPLAWQAQQRTTPERDVDRANLARVFRTDDASARDERAGSLARRIATVLEATVFATITHLLDYHCYGRDTAVRMALYRTGQARAAYETSARMTRAFGLGVLRAVSGGPGTTAAYTERHGIPTCVVEMGGTHTQRASEDVVVRLGTDGALRIMQALEMIATAPPGPAEQLVIERAVTIQPQASGYYLPAFDLEDLFAPAHPHGIFVSAGQTLGQIFDTYTLDVVETVTAPEDGYLIALLRGGPHQVGGPGLTLANGHRA